MFRACGTGCDREAGMVFEPDEAGRGVTSKHHQRPSASAEVNADEDKVETSRETCSQGKSAGTLEG